MRFLLTRTISISYYPCCRHFSSLEDKFWPVDPGKLFDIIDELDRIAEAHGTTVAQAALNYLLQKPGVASLIVGMRTAKQLEQNLEATDWQMTPEEVARLDCLSEPSREYPYYLYDPEAGAYFHI